jgi:hypothetical protein
MNHKAALPVSSVLARLRASADERPPFIEGLALGALVGAAIAGSTLWARIRDARRDTERRRVGPEGPEA